MRAFTDRSVDVPARVVASLLVSAALVAPAGAAAPAGPAWRQSSFDAGHTWFNRDETMLSSANVGALSERWARTLGQFYVGPTVQSGEAVFVCSNLYGLSALAAATGRIGWSNPDLPGLNCGSPAVRGQTVYVTTSDATPNVGHLSAVDAATGTLRWTSSWPDADSLGFENPTLSGDTVFVTDRRHAIHAVDAATGALRWRAETPWLQNAATVAGGKVVVTTWDACCTTAVRKVYAFDAATGSSAWVAPADGSNMQYPATILGPRVYAGSDSGRVRAYDLATGALLWQRRLDGYISAPIAAGRQRVIVSSANRTLSALDAATGEVVWTRSIAPWSIASNLAIAADVVYMTVNDPFVHRLATFDLATGEVLPQAATTSLTGSRAQLSVVDGRVQMSTSQGVLHVYAQAR